MPELKFYLSGSVIGTIHADVVPSPGAEVTFVMDTYKKGYVPGSVISFIVEGEHCLPTNYDYSGDDVVAHIDVGGFTLVKAGPDLPD